MKLASIKFAPNGGLEVVDQRALPEVEQHVLLSTLDDVCEAISNMTVRGAPLLGIVAAQGMAFAGRDGISLGEAKSKLDSTRPTAVNLARMTKRMLAKNGGDLFAEVQQIAEEERLACEQMALLGASLMHPNPQTGQIRIIHHCNTGSLCTYGLGTALGCVVKKHEQTGNVFVFVDETRPRQQGLRLTGYELTKQQVPFQIMPDSAAGSVLRQGKADLVIFGADRICANGDVINKIGTYSLSVLAKESGVPVYCVAPMSTVDFATSNGDLVEIEERNGEEVVGELPFPAYNPAFDVTPFKYITAIVTERGICYPPFAANLAKLRLAVDEEEPVVASLAKLTVTVPPAAASVKRTGRFLGDEEEDSKGDVTKPSSFRSNYPQSKTHIGEETSALISTPSSSVRQFAQIKKSSIVLGDQDFTPFTIKSSVRIHQPQQQSELEVHSAQKGHFPGQAMATPVTVTEERHSLAKGQRHVASSSSNGQIFG
ncbi:S-methyl-5-thioribose-1-phosphate isomerase [Batrachochytrium salamandrivorans]|nr:S-methyl-5-thioribose-1-phosphate isomerase [Batrachochytrium salamandrivorans]